MRRGGTRELTTSVGYHDLLADLRHAGCPVCRGAHRAAWRYLDALLWESVTDPGIRAQLRAAHGFCREHWQMALSVASVQSAGSGVAILAEDLLRHVLADAVDATDGASPRRRRVPAFGPEASCPACVTAERTATSYLEILASAEEGTEPRDAIARHGRGLCVGHLTSGLALVRDPEARARLLAIFRRGVEELRSELAEFGRKQDYRFRPEGISQSEATSWRRGVYRLSGEPIPTREPTREPTR